MDKVLEILLVATVLLISAVVVLTLLQTFSEDTSSSMDSVRESNICSYEANTYSCGDEISSECLDYIEDEKDKKCAENNKLNELLTS